MNKSNSTKTSELRHRRDAPLATPTDLTRSATKDIAGAMNAILADVFVDTVNRAYADTSGVDAVNAKTGYGPWHRANPLLRSLGV